MFSLSSNESHWLKYDWTKMTTVVMVNYISSDLMCYSHQHNTRAVILVNYPTANLTNPPQRTAWVQKMLKTVLDNYLDGINIDYEGEIPINRTDLRGGYTLLVRETYETFKKASRYLQVTADVAWSPACIDIRCYDYHTLGLFTDFLFVMGYSEQSQMLGECVAMANSGYQQTLTGLLGYMRTEQIPSSRLVLGVTWGGMMYKCINLTEDNFCVLEQIPWRGQNCSDLAGKGLDWRNLVILWNGSQPEVVWDINAQTPYYNYKDPGTGQMYQVWFDNPKSLKIKADLANKLGLRGVGVWNTESIDYSDPKQIRELWGSLPYYPH